MSTVARDISVMKEIQAVYCTHPILNTCVEGGRGVRKRRDSQSPRDTAKLSTSDVDNEIANTHHQDEWKSKFQQQFLANVRIHRLSTFRRPHERWDELRGMSANGRMWHPPRALILPWWSDVGPVGTKVNTYIFWKSSMPKLLLELELNAICAAQQAIRRAIWLRGWLCVNFSACFNHSLTVKGD
jgi:hypothetical protein